MFIERNGNKYYLEETLYIQGIHIVRKVELVGYTTGPTYKLRKEKESIPIIEGETMKHFPEIKLTQ
ncbi:hypothetical protein SAMN04488506_1218 [Desemzia incerta]|uniref:Uncharacterized protein n=1 Tax=Desemzia incerta TaxID=82801 RepID=A0A1I5X6C1_9LACT|nr:hypothetical protein [Desemzia incerta]SFQ27494.1 hypothetical protein SAMN04488506_1218 [Desemzia incerta]